jgi:phosphohistidine phosphatase SixA
MTLLPLLALLLAGLGAGAAPPPAEYYVMRHLQRDSGADPGLNQEGRRNAEALASWFGRRPPTAIYVSATRRARETAAPLAARLGLTVKQYDPADTAGLVAGIRREGGVVLIVGHSNTVPEIVALLGGSRPADIADDRYGDVWHVFGPGPATEHKRLGD